MAADAQSLVGAEAAGTAAVEVEEGGLFGGDDFGLAPAAESGLALRILRLRSSEAEMRLADAERWYAVLKARLLREAGDGDADGGLALAGGAVLAENYDAISGAVERVWRALEGKEATEVALRSFLDVSEGGGRLDVTTELESTIDEFLTDIVNVKFFGVNNKGDSGGERSASPWDETGAIAEKFVDGIRKRGGSHEGFGCHAGQGGVQGRLQGEDCRCGLPRRHHREGNEERAAVPVTGRLLDGCHCKITCNCHAFQLNFCT